MAAFKDNRKRKGGYMYIAVYVSWLEDRPMSQIPLVALGAYLRLYLLAARFNKAGKLIDRSGPLNIEDFAFTFRCDEQEIQEAIEVLEYAGLLERDGEAWYIPSFTEEQIDLDERREKWRETQSMRRKKKHGFTPGQEPEEEQKEELDVEPDLEEDEESDTKINVESNIDPDRKTEKYEEAEKEIKPYVEIDKNKRKEIIEVEEEVETPRGVFEDTSRTPASAAATINLVYDQVKSKIFRDVYREVRNKYKTDDVFAGIRAMVEVTVLHNLHSEDKWDHYNKEMAVELCDPVRRQQRIERELKAYKQSHVGMEEMMQEWLDEIRKDEDK